MLDLARRAPSALAAAAFVLAAAAPSFAQQDPRPEGPRPDFPYPVTFDASLYQLASAPPNWPDPPLGEGPFDLQSWEQRDYRVTVLARGLAQPRSLVFLPDGDLLISEIGGKLRLFRGGKLLPGAVPGTPEVFNRGSNGLRDIALHPDFARNHLIYLTYDRPVWDGLSAPSVWRGTWTGDAIAGGEPIFEGDDVETGTSRAEFGPDGKLYVTIGGPANGPHEALIRAQHPDDYAGKILRLNDDGSIPADNPFAGQEGVNPEIFTLGHRNNLGLTVNPWTNELWASEQGPNGGDEIDILKAGKNYGWPVVSDGRHYTGQYVSETPLSEGFERPWVAFVPSPALSGMTFYTGDSFPAWKRSLFVGSLRFGETPRTGHLLRIAFNDKWEEVRREMLLVELHQRIRDVTQGPDGLLYVITGEDDGALLRIEPS